MRILSSYVTGQVVRPMLAIVLVALAALLAERMLRVVDLVIGWRGSLFVMFEILGYLIPHYIGLALPASFFIAILIAISRLARDGELDAMNAAGLSTARITKPLIWVALVLAVINAFTLSHLQPYSRYAYRAALFTLSNVSFQALLKARTFVTLEGTTYFTDTLSADHLSVGGLLLFSERPDGASLALTAKQGQLIRHGIGEPIDLKLEDGVQQFVPAADPESTAPESSTVRFKNFTSDLKGYEPKPDRPRGEDERELTIPELWANLGTKTKVGSIDPWEIAAEFHGRIARILSTFALPLVAVPLAIGRRRSQRSYGMLVGVALLLAYNQIIGFGESIADNNKASPYLSIWGPFVAFFALGIFLTWRRSTRVPGGSERSWIDELGARLTSWINRREAPARPAA
jgi:lipopolysaccharide export system permease protein